MSNLTSKQLYPTLQIRIDRQTKDDFLELAELRGTTISTLLKTFIQNEVAALPRERRGGMIVRKPTEDFLA